MEDEADTAQEAPQVVSVPVVGQLMLDHMPQPRRVLRRLRRHIDGGASKPEKAGGVRFLREVDRQGLPL